MDLQLSGKTALVTGASAGIGTGIADALAREGVRLVISGRNRAALDDVAARIAGAGNAKPAVVVGDLATDKGPADIAAASLDALGGRIDILINNAGGSRPISGEDSEELWEESFNLNFAGARRLTKRVIPAMKAARWGRIMSVTGAIVGQKLNAAGPAKAALATWSRALAFELGPYGITVNTIAPGRINSVQILTRLHPTEQSRADYIRQNIPAGYFGEPYDIGYLVTFLASPLARYISGAAIPVDGGAVRLAL
jgi:3-oxoacyl-[acyl-carrier protein] reductase